MIDQKKLTFAFLILILIIVLVVIFFGKKSNIIESFSPHTTMYLMYKDSADNLSTSNDIGITNINSKDKYINGNSTMSGKTSLQGDLTFDNNVSIKGKLSIPNYNVEDELRSILNRLKLLEESSSAHNTVINNLKSTATSHNSIISNLENITDSHDISLKPMEKDIIAQICWGIVRSPCRQGSKMG